MWVDEQIDKAMHKTGTITDLDKVYRDLCINLAYRIKIGTINDKELRDRMLEHAYLYKKHFARICGKELIHD